MPRPDDLFRIGEVAQMFHLSVSSLRSYERLGILTPEYTDPDSGYRYYSTAQFEVLNTIRYLRLLDASLEDIAEFVRSRDLNRIQELLRQQKETIAEKRRSLEILERKIQNRLTQIGDAVSSELGVIRQGELPERRLALLQVDLEVGPDLDLEPSIRTLESRQPEAMIFLGKVGVSVSRENLLRGEYRRYSSVFLLLDREDDYRGETETDPPHPGVTVRFQGSHLQAETWYERLAAFCADHHLRPAGDSQEITLIDYGLTDDPAKFVTEIQIPVEPAL